MLDVAVIGCGIVGANVAYLLSQHKLRAAVFEKENDVSMGTTRANSAIVHAGYDPEPGTAMARLNVRGSALTKEQCAAFDVKYRQIGSLVLAFSDEEMATVRRLYENGVANGVPGVRVLTREETLAMEPNLSDVVCGALYAPSAAIVEPWDLALALAEAAVENGVELHLETAVTGAEKISGGWRLHTAKGDFEARAVVNAAGVEADLVAAMAGEPGFTTIPSRGEYYLLDKSQGLCGEPRCFPVSQPRRQGCARFAYGSLQPYRRPQCGAQRPRGRFHTGGRAGIRAGKGRQERAGRKLPGKYPQFCGRARQYRPKRFYHWGDRARLHHAGRHQKPGLSSAPAIAEDALALVAGAGVTLEKKESFVHTRTKNDSTK